MRGHDLSGSVQNLTRLFERASADDIRDGRGAYQTYHRVIDEFARHYGTTFERALSAFVALSPNSDYQGNLRSLASVLMAARDGIPCQRVTVSTYKHCRDRAYSYVTGRRLFLVDAKGLKVRSFFLNILDPDDPRPVTVDGHICCAWRGVDAPMKQATVRPSEYERIASGIRRFAKAKGMLPNQMQATLWMARKRLLRIRYEGQLDLFRDAIFVRPEDAKPYQLESA